MQQIIFPMEYLNITQGYGVGTHIGSYAIDNAGRDVNIDNLFAPFDGVIKKIWENGNTVWIESINPVEFADGSKDYAVASFTHDNNVSDLKVGQVIKQGVNFYQEGTAGKATGNHVHIEIGKGKFRGSGWYQIPAGQPGAGSWVINDKYKPEDAFYLSGTEILNTGGYPWVSIGGDMGATKEELIVEYGLAFPNQLVNEQWVKNNVGRNWSDVLNDLRDDPSRQAYITGLVTDADAYNNGESKDYELITTDVYKRKGTK